MAIRNIPKPKLDVSGFTKQDTYIIGGGYSLDSLTDNLVDYISLTQYKISGNEYIYTGGSDVAGVGISETNGKVWLADDNDVHFGLTPPSDSIVIATYDTDGSGNITRYDPLFIKVPTDHNSLNNLDSDDHTQYVNLNGRSGGQTLYGGTDSSDNLTIDSTSDATKGNIILNSNVGIGLTPSYELHVDGNININDTYGYLINGNDINTGGTLDNIAYLDQNNIFTSGQFINTDDVIAFRIEQDGVNDNVFVVDTVNGRIGINTLPVSDELEVDGNIIIAGNIGLNLRNPQSELTFSTDGSTISTNTSDGSDNKYLQITGGGSADVTRGSNIKFYGNEHATNAGELNLYSGDVNADMNFTTYGTGEFNFNNNLNISGNLDANIVICNQIDVSEYAIGGGGIFANFTANDLYLGDSDGNGWDAVHLVSDSGSSIKVDGLSNGIFVNTTRTGFNTSTIDATIDAEGDGALLPAPDSALGDSSFENNQYMIWVDETTDEIKIKVRKSDGTFLNKTI